MYITLDMAKKHLNIDEYFTDDDEYIVHLILAAEDAISAHIDAPLSVYETVCGELEEGLKHGILLLVAHFYNSREAVSFGQGTEVPLSFQYLINKYIKYDGYNASGDS